MLTLDFYQSTSREIRSDSKMKVLEIQSDEKKEPTRVQRGEA